MLHSFKLHSTLLILNKSYQINHIDTFKKKNLHWDYLFNFYFRIFHKKNKDITHSAKLSQQKRRFSIKINLRARHSRLNFERDKAFHENFHNKNSTALQCGKKRKGGDNNIIVNFPTKGNSQTQFTRKAPFQNVGAYEKRRNRPWGGRTDGRWRLTEMIIRRKKMGPVSFWINLLTEEKSALCRGNAIARLHLRFSITRNPRRG